MNERARAIAPDAKGWSTPPRQHAARLPRPGNSPAGELLRLQQSAGNQALLRLIEFSMVQAKEEEETKTDTFLTPEETDKVIKTGESWIGVPYLYGGNSREGIDCSHFVHRAYAEAGFNYEYRNTGSFPTSPNFVQTTDVRTADVALFSGHMGIYNSTPPKAGKTILSATTGNGVCYGAPGWFNGTPVFYRYKKTA